MISEIGQAISTYGFPIVMCGGLFWYMVTEMRELRSTVNNNTAAMLRILEHFQKEDIT